MTVQFTRVFLTRVLVVLLACQSPAAFAFSCVDHAAHEVEPAMVMPMAEDCSEHGSMSQVPDTRDDTCCDDNCLCPAAMAVALAAENFDQAAVLHGQQIAASMPLFASQRPERILHPPIQ